MTAAAFDVYLPRRDTERVQDFTRKNHFFVAVRIVIIRYLLVGSDRHILNDNQLICVRQRHGISIVNIDTKYHRQTACRELNKNARPGAGACRTICCSLQMTVRNRHRIPQTPRINMPISIRDAGASFSSACAEALCFCDSKS